MRLSRIFCGITTVGALISLLSCGGGGGGGGTTASNTPSDALGLQADLANVAYVSLSDSASAVTTTAMLDKNFIQKFFDIVLPNAFAFNIKSNNVFSFDSNGDAIGNPFKSNVNVFISAAALDPSGEYFYIGIDSHINSKLFQDFAQINNPCSIYRVKVSTGSVKCLAKENEYDFNGESLSDNIIFDKLNRAYFIGRKNNSIYGSGGTEKTRLIRIDTDGTLNAVVDQAGYIAGSMARGKRGAIFFSENLTSSGGQGRLSILNTNSNVISTISGVFSNNVRSSADGEIYLISNNNLYKLDQSGLNSSLVISGGVIGFSDGDPNSISVLKSNGDLYSLNYSTVSPVENIGPYDSSVFPLKNNTSDIRYPMLIVKGDYAIGKGVNSGSQQVCLINTKQMAKRCMNFSSYNNVSILSMAIVSNTGLVYFKTNSAYKQAEFDVRDMNSSIVITDSLLGDGGLITSVSMRAPVSLATNANNISARTIDRKTTVTLGGTSESMTVLDIVFDAPVNDIDLDSVIIKNASGTVLDSEKSIVEDGFIIRVRVKDPTSGAALKYKLFPNGTILNITLPSEVILPGLLFTSTITTRNISTSITSN